MKNRPDVNDDLSGLTLGDWQLQKRLGQGATAQVYLADSVSNPGWQRAIKVFSFRSKTRKEREDYLGRIKLEAELGKQPIHENVITLAEPPHVQKDLIFHVMPYADGGSLQALIERRIQNKEQIPIETVCHYGLQIAAGLDALHKDQRGLIHRDICPANLLISGQKILIADLGVAQTYADLTLRSQLDDDLAPPHPGHRAYMSPDQANNRRPVMPSDDIFAVGCVLFELLTLQQYQGSVSLEPHPQRYRSDTPIWLDAIIAHCLIEQRPSRLQTAEILYQSLEKKHLVSPPVVVVPATHPPEVYDLRELLGDISTEKNQVQ